MFNRIAFSSIKRAPNFEVAICNTYGGHLRNYQADEKGENSEMIVNDVKDLSPVAANTFSSKIKSSVKAHGSKANKLAVSFEIPEKSTAGDLQRRALFSPSHNKCFEPKHKRVVKTGRVAKHKPITVVQWKTNRATNRHATDSCPRLTSFSDPTRTHVAFEKPYKLRGEKESWENDGYDLQTSQVPEWARGPALQDALDIQYGTTGDLPTDPDLIFQSAGLCDLEEIFEPRGGGHNEKMCESVEVNVCR